MNLLPAAFMHLQDLFMWIQGDDKSRSDHVEQATSKELLSFVQRLFPELPAINSYLDIHDDESAHALGRLAEAACEAQIELARRKENA